MALAYSYTVDQLWADKSPSERTGWFNKHSERLALSRGAVINALRDHAKVIAETRAHEHHAFDQDEWVNGQLDRLDYALAPEVREWLEG